MVNGFGQEGTKFEVVAVMQARGLYGSTGDGEFVLYFGGRMGKIRD